jgi:hypothetical protein
MKRVVWILVLVLGVLSTVTGLAAADPVDVIEPKAVRAMQVNGGLSLPWSR